MKKLLSIISLILVISMSLCSCERQRTYEDNQLSMTTWSGLCEPVGVFVEIPTTDKLPLGTKYDLRVGIGLNVNGGFEGKAPGFFRIGAKGFLITDKDGNEYRDEYVLNCDDFSKEPYRTTRHEFQRFEDFSLQFVGDINAEYVRTTKQGLKYIPIGFSIDATLQQNQEGMEDYYAMDGFTLYAVFDVNGDKMKLTFLDPWTVANYEIGESVPELSPVS